jgi:xylulose-5-phosphate/fructose-6-phosphate phosphoketolase
VDRFTLAIDVIDRVPSLKVRGADGRDALMNQQLDCRQYGYAEGINPSEIANWTWPL